MNITVRVDHSGSRVPQCWIIGGLLAYNGLGSDYSGKAHRFGDTPCCYVLSFTLIIKSYWALRDCHVELLLFKSTDRGPWRSTGEKRDSREGFNLRRSRGAKKPFDQSRETSNGLISLYIAENARLGRLVNILLRESPP